MRSLLVVALLAVTGPLAAKDSLGVFSGWAAFRDPSVPRCYAIAMPEPHQSERELEPFASVGSWPRRQLRSQVHFRTSRMMAPRAAISLTVGQRRFRLTGGGGDAWAKDRTMDAAIVSAMRSAASMTIQSVDRRGRRFANTYSLAGAATAIDAATLSCARV